MHVLLLRGGYSNEREVCLRSAATIKRALVSLGHEVTEVDPTSDTFDLTPYLQGVNVAFIAIHGAGGEDGVFQQQLEQAGIPFVGSGSQASKLCYDKWAYKQKILKAGLPASQGALITNQDIDHVFFSRPFVLKPLTSGSSVDTIISKTAATDNDKVSVAILLQKYSQMLLEPLVNGTEITVGILGDTSLPVVEIIPPTDGEFDYDNKYNGATQELCPPVHVPEDKQREAQALALQIHRLTGCRHMSRTDMIIDHAGNLHVLETNTMPGMTAQSLLPKMTAAAGMTFEMFIQSLLEMAKAR